METMYFIVGAYFAANIFAACTLGAKAMAHKLFAHRKTWEKIIALILWFPALTLKWVKAVIK